MMRFQWAALLLGALSLNCSDTVEPRLPPWIEMSMGDGQVGTVGEALEVPFVVRVRDYLGRGLADAEVFFRVESGDGAFHDSGDPCSPLFPTEIVSTTADGYAGVSLTPLSVGPVTVAAGVSGYPNAPPLIFTAEARSPGWVLSKVSGDNQEAATYDQLRDSFVAKLATAQGEPVSGVAMVWNVTSGGGALLGSVCGDLDTIPTTLTVRTIADGTTGPSYHGVQFRPSVYGTSTVAASVAGAQGSPVTFTAEATPQVIYLFPNDPSFHAQGFDPASVTVPVGALVEWRIATDSAHVVGVSTPPGGTALDSGRLDESGGFQFIPDVPGTWEYVDEVGGARGTLTAS